MNKIQNATKHLKQMDKRCCTFLDEAAVCGWKMICTEKKYLRLFIYTLEIIKK